MLGVGWEQKAPKPVQLPRAGEGGKETERLTCFNSQMLEGSMAPNSSSQQHRPESSLRSSAGVIAVFCSKPPCS